MSNRTNGSEHPRTLDSLYNNGLSYCQLGRYGEGLPLLRECVAGRRKVLGEGDPGTQKAIQALESYEQAAAVIEEQVQEEEEEETVADRLRKRRRLR